MAVETYFTLRKNKILRVHEEEVCGNQHFLNELNKNASFTVKDLFKLTDYPNLVSLTIKDNYLLLGIELDFLRIKSIYAVDNTEKTLIPQFLNDQHNYPQYLPLDLLWPIPEDMRIFFILHIPKNYIICNGLKFASEACLMCVHPKEPGYWRIPLPNLYDTMRICLGSNIEETIKAKDFGTLLSMYLEVFYNSVWGGDLNHNPQKTKLFFVFKAEDSTPIYPKDWTKLTNGKTNNKYIDDIAPVLLKH